VVLLCAVFLSIKYFTGVENSHHYAGYSINAMYPDLMTKDPYVGTTLSAEHSPYKLTIYYLLPKLFGEIWLDDRFIAILYILMVAATFLAADRLAVALGAQTLAERMIVLLLFLKDHTMFENTVNFAHHPDFHHSALALPIGLWLLWAAVRGKGLILVLLMSALLAAMSLQVAPYTIAMALIAVAFTGQKKWERTSAISLLAIGSVAALYVLFVHIQIPAGDRNAIWELLVYHWYEGMVAPFDPSFMGLTAVIQGTVILGAVFLFVLFWPATLTPALKSTRLIVAVSMAAWIIMGLYGHFAPDGAKFPQLLLFPIIRQLQYPQILAYIAAAIIILRWGAEKQDLKRVGLSVVFLSILVVSGPGNYHLWTTLLSVSLIAVTIGYYLLSKNQSAQPAYASLSNKLTQNYRPVYATALGLTMMIALSYATWQKLPAWKFLMATGIHGVSQNAPWVGVAEWVRANTPKDAVILPLQYSTSVIAGPRGFAKNNLVMTRSVSSRSGRATPLHLMLARGLDLKYFQFAQEQKRYIKELTIAWIDGDVPTLTSTINKLIPQPNYLIAPTPAAERVLGKNFPFKKIAQVRQYTVMLRRDEKNK